MLISKVVIDEVLVSDSFESIFDEDVMSQVEPQTITTGITLDHPSI